MRYLAIDNCQNASCSSTVISCCCYYLTVANIA
uniref:Uncharacterized protein n=1 Tax=Anguilla anguilla TaxID=7936 RepID=A0A0E9Q915_ANGAN